MQKSRLIPRRLALASATVVLVGAGAGAALAAQHQSGPRERVLGDAAQRLGVKPAALKQALDAALGDQVDAALKAGKITKAQADEMKARIKQGLGPLRPMGPLGRRGPGHRADLIKAAGDYLGLTPAQMRQAHEQGKTLADLAQQQGKTTAGLEQAIKDAAKSDLDRAVKAGKLTDTQEQQLLDRLSSHLDDLVNGRGTSPRPDGPGGPGGGGPQGQQGP